jgi:hypothetical protein
MQNTDASVALAGVPVLMAPDAAPFSVIVRHAVLPKQPNACPLVLLWPGQKFPVELLLLAVPVVSGERLMGITPARAPSQQLSPAVQGQLQRNWQVSPAVRRSASVVHAVPGQPDNAARYQDGPRLVRTADLLIRSRRHAHPS